MDKYYLVKKEALPEYFSKVLEVKKMLEHGYNISNACKKVGLSRTAFYKYKDAVYEVKDLYSKQAILLVRLKETTESLTNLLKDLRDLGIEILTLNREETINKVICLTMKVRLMDNDFDLTSIFTKIKELDNVIYAKILVSE